MGAFLTKLGRQHGVLEKKRSQSSAWSLESEHAANLFSLLRHLEDYPH